MINAYSTPQLKCYAFFTDNKFEKKNIESWDFAKIKNQQQHMPVKKQGNNSLQMAITYFQTKNTCTFQAF